MAIKNLPKTVAGLENLALGQFGAAILSTAGQDFDGDWSVIVAMQDTTFTTLNTTTCLLNAVTGSPSNLNGLTLLKGLPLYGRFSRINLQSGQVIAYFTGDPS